jgi:hypothetical protein
LKINDNELDTKNLGGKQEDQVEAPVLPPAHIIDACEIITTGKNCYAFVHKTPMRDTAMSVWNLLNYLLIMKIQISAVIKFPFPEFF